MSNERAIIDDFLAQKRIAFVGLSTEEHGFSHYVLQELLARGYDVVPVNPKTRELAGRRAYPTVSAIPEPVDAALIMTPASATPDILRDCAIAGVKRVWLHRGTGLGSVSGEALAVAEELGMDVVPGECPLMFLRNPAWYHRVHAFGRQLMGRYPEHCAGC